MTRTQSTAMLNPSVELRLRRTLSARRKRWERGNVSGRNLQSSVEEARLASGRILHHGDRLAPLLNPAHHYKEAGARDLHLCLYQNEPMSYGQQQPPRNKDPHGRPWDVWDGVILQKVPIIRSENLKISRKSLLVTCYENRNSHRNPRRSLRTCAVAARVGSLDLLAAALSLASVPL